MRRQEVRVDRNVPRERQLAWMIAELAADSAPVNHDVAEMIVNQIISLEIRLRPDTMAAITPHCEGIF